MSQANILRVDMGVYACVTGCATAVRFGSCEPVFFIVGGPHMQGHMWQLFDNYRVMYVYEGTMHQKAQAIASRG